jgi:hypothetical protein
LIIDQFSGAGEMFWLNRNTLSGSYLRLMAASRAYVCGGYAARSAPPSPEKFPYKPPPNLDISSRLRRAHSTRHAMTLSERQQFQQGTRFAEPPSARGNGNTVDLDVEAAQQPDANLLWRHVLSVVRPASSS